ncbi:Protein kinase superfamily protein [Euphorbia peplus]|nr:Protein kinase superfamily protein [Euphorbia peplus]
MYNLIELKEATSNFSPGNRLGQPIFGFKGFIHGQAVFVQRIDPEGWIGDKMSMGKLEHVEKLCHPNIVKMIGYCLEDDDTWDLVYEFVPTNLKDYFCGNEDSEFPRYSWSIFMKIVLGVAKGLAFLHEAHVMYDEFRPSDVLLDLECNVKLNDFGLTNQIQREGNRVDKYFHRKCIHATEYTPRDPDFWMRGTTPKSNVYGFGVMLLEMLSGKEARSIKKPDYTKDVNAKRWAKSFLDEHKSSHVLNASSDQHFGRNVVFVAQLVFYCLSPNLKYRPDMNQVVQYLECVRLN